MASHLAWPLRLAPDGSLATLEQDSPEEISQSVELVLLTTPGERVDAPDFGLEDPAFRDVSAGEIVAAITRWEPRADAAVVVSDVQTGRRTVRVDAQAAGGS
jgi:phage baseplate assembly protein W